MTNRERTGLVISRHRREVLIEDDRKVTHQALIRGRRLRPLAGDRVGYMQHSDGTISIEGIEPRSTVLERIDSRGRAEGIAANVSQIVVVFAPEPRPDWQLVDRYLVAAGLIGIKALLIRNKSDIAAADVDERARVYAAIGYAVIETCAKSGAGLEAARRALMHHRSVLVGQSGVGKSSLLNSLLDTAAQTVGDLSKRKSLGRHTTTAAILYRLPSGGELIDSPGVRRYAPKIQSPDALARGFIEFADYLGHCRFNDCRHRDEPDCAIRSAVEDGRIAKARYLSFCALSDTFDGLSGR
jgi:ribosome biogenesis GTPase